MDETSTCALDVRACVSLTVCALHLRVVARLYEADVAQVKDASDDLQHLSLDVSRDSNHLHGFLETSAQKEKREREESRGSLHLKSALENRTKIEITYILYCISLYFFDCKLLMSAHVTSNAWRSVLGPKSDLI